MKKPTKRRRNAKIGKPTKRKAKVKKAVVGVSAGQGVPRRIRTGMVLFHNDVAHDVDTPNGWRGFRAWFIKTGDMRGYLAENPDFKPCGCGWSGLPHYSSRPDYKCEAEEAIQAQMRHL